ncbi:hypothetical protein [Nocardia sp. NPDC006630]|uniref:hypothetical protein n=1 Tax=unclassified Nocardia TaxID=2637762 RepID=UPI0032475159
MIAAALIALPLLAACSSGGDSAPAVTHDQLAASLQKGGLDAKAADCAAKMFIDQGISQDGLRLMMKTDSKSGAGTDAESLGMSTADADKARTAANNIVASCMK